MTPSDTFLVIDDEPQIRRAVRNALAPLGARVLEAATGREGLALAASERPALIVLDLGLPDMQGEDVCREIRSLGQMPIIVLSSRHEEEEKLALLTTGADDYVTKPFSLRELVARARVHLRRAAMATPAARPHLSLGTLMIDFDGHRVTRAGEPVKLTATEWKLLAALAAQAGRTMTHRQIFDAVWGRAAGSPHQHLRVHLTNLRRKLEVDPSNPVLIVTEPGVGYRLEPPAAVEGDA